MNFDSLPLNAHYPPVSHKPNTYNQLQAAASPPRPWGVSLPWPLLGLEQALPRFKVGATEPPKQT